MNKTRMKKCTHGELEEARSRVMHSGRVNISRFYTSISGTKAKKPWGRRVAVLRKMKKGEITKDSVCSFLDFIGIDCGFMLSSCDVSKGKEVDLFYTTDEEGVLIHYCHKKHKKS